MDKQHGYSIKQGVRKKKGKNQIFSYTSFKTFPFLLCKEL